MFTILLVSRFAALPRSHSSGMTAWVPTLCEVTRMMSYSTSFNVYKYKAYKAELCGFLHSELVVAWAQVE
jgi:hypothetical protein